MSGVVLRCPHCGTTKAVPGECEACHEAQVRYYCTNHTPGRWLDARACPQCGARFGDPARAPAAPAPAASVRTPAPAPAPASPAPAPASTAAPRYTGSRSRPPEAGGGPWGRRGRSPSPEEAPGLREERIAARNARAARLSELLRAASRRGRIPEEATHVPEAAPTGPRLGGCLIRFVSLAVFLLFLLFSMFFVLGGSLLQLFGLYY